MPHSFMLHLDSFISTHFYLIWVFKNHPFSLFFPLKKSLGALFGSGIIYSLSSLLSLFFEYHSTLSAEKALHGSSLYRRCPWRRCNQAVAVYLLSLNLAEPRYLSTASLDLPH